MPISPLHLQEQGICSWLQIQFFCNSGILVLMELMDLRMLQKVYRVCIGEKNTEAFKQIVRKNDAMGFGFRPHAKCIILCWF